jgi:arylsulfatase A-like enzyme
MHADRTWQKSHTFDWGPVDLPDEKFRDFHVVRWAGEQLQGKLEEPFFLGVGIHLPHQPLYNPKRFHDLYPPAGVTLPPHIKNDLDDLSKSGREFALIPTTSGTHATVVRYGQWHDAVSSYLASASFVDELVGTVLAALQNSKHAENTWILLWSDHGWHLGEKEHWGKATGWYRATRVPFIIVPPAAKAAEFAREANCKRPVNLIDLYPTIVAAAGLPARPDLEGRSLLPLVRQPAADWASHTVTTFGRGNHAISTERWRYIQYFDGSAELYDRQNDPDEWRNVIDNPENAGLIKQLEQHIPAEKQWKHFIRFGHFKAVVPSDGSKMLLFNHDVENHLEERHSEADDYPEVVATIEKWLAEHQPEQRHIVIPES